MAMISTPFNLSDLCCRIKRQTAADWYLLLEDFIMKQQEVFEQQHFVSDVLF